MCAECKLPPLRATSCAACIRPRHGDDLILPVAYASVTVRILRKCLADNWRLRRLDPEKAGRAKVLGKAYAGLQSDKSAESIMLGGDRRVRNTGLLLFNAHISARRWIDGR
jgi:hypothetical protein